MKRLTGYPSWFYGVLLLSITVVAVSGCLMIPTMLEFKLEWDMDWRLSGGQRLWWVSLHMVFSWLLMMGFGSLWQVHMRAGWRKKQNRKSGTLTAALLLLLTASGVGLYYFSALNWQANTAVTHTLAGITLMLVFVWHAVAGYRIRRAASR